MADDISAGLNDGGLWDALNRHPGRLFRALKKRVGGHLFRWAGQFAAKAFRGGNLHIRSGAFLRSFGSIAHGNDIHSLRFVTGTVRGDVPYASIHEHGGVIRPVAKKFLTIPLDAAKHASGVTRARAPFFENTFFKVSKAGNLFLMQRTDSGEVRPLFLLKKQVTIPGRLGFYAAFDRQMSDLIRHFNDSIEEALQGDKVA